MLSSILLILLLGRVAYALPSILQDPFLLSSNELPKQSLETPTSVQVTTTSDFKLDKLLFHDHSHNWTAYQVLKHHPEFTKWTKLIEFSGEELVSYLNDSSLSATFFVVPNRALRPHGNSSAQAELFNEVVENGLSGPLNLSAILSAVEFSGSIGDDDDKGKEALKKIVKAVLRYHIIPEHGYNSSSLVRNMTFPTELSHVAGALDEAPLRIRVSQGVVFPTISINSFSKIIHKDVSVLNGILHVVSHPLIPPPSVFQQLFFLQRIFSTFTSAVQKAGLVDLIDYRFEKESRNFKGSPAVTVFAPSNEAFAKLPPKLRAFLFSPLGAKALKALLQIHIVPGVVFHSDWSLNLKSGAITDQYANNDGPFLDGRTIVGQYEEPEVIFGWQSIDDTPELPMSLPQFPTEVPKIPIPEIPNPPKLPLPSSDPTVTRKWPPWPRPEPTSTPPRPPHLPNPIYHANYTLETANEHVHLNAQVTKYAFKRPFPPGKALLKYSTFVLVNNQISSFIDGVSLNGAIHVVSRLIHPWARFDQGIPNDSREWEDWEEWLPMWAKLQILD